MKMITFLPQWGETKCTFIIALSTGIVESTFVEKILSVLIDHLLNTAKTAELSVYKQKRLVSEGDKYWLFHDSYFRSEFGNWYTNPSGTRTAFYETNGYTVIASQNLIFRKIEKRIRHSLDHDGFCSID